MSAATLFVTAGIPAAVLVTRAGNKPRKRTMRFPDAPAALAWCIKTHTSMVYIAASAAANN